jgi:hypothetical protein
LDFWQFEVGLFNDMKMVDLNEKYGTLGEAVYFRILSYIADSEGYYAVLSDSLILSIYRSIGSRWIRDKQVILRIIHYCGECGLFDVKLLSQNVITSCGIQRRWLYAKEKARAKGFTTDKFWLLNSQGCGFDTQNLDKCSNNTDKCDNNTDKCDNNSPYISKEKISKETPNPLQGGGGENWKEKFFNLYTQFAKKNYHDTVIDYKVLIDEFDKSAYLQKMYSFPQVIRIYEQIANGDFRDLKTEQQQRIDAVNDRAERERYYSALQEKAWAIAEKNLARAKQYKLFDEITQELSIIEIEIAKAELYKPTELKGMQDKRAKLQGDMERCLNLIGLTESDIKPKWKCNKCNDTGWQEDGRACDCYLKE